MKICTLVSGSSGNCIYIESEKTRVLIDAGISARQIEAQLSKIGTSLKEIDAVLITHEHIDHIRGIPTIASRHGMPILGCRDVMTALSYKAADILPDRFAAFDLPDFSVGDLCFSAFDVPHDSAGCVGYVVECGESKIAIVTDIGHISENTYEKIKGATCVVIESNYDEMLLRTGRYPAILKKRVASGHGHLSNRNCAETVARLAKDGTKHFILFHLSENNNTPALALSAVCGGLTAAGFSAGEVTVNVAPRYDISGVFGV